MQEVAQLVAWVKQHPARPGADNRVLLSKVGLELYISIKNRINTLVAADNTAEFGPGSDTYRGYKDPRSRHATAMIMKLPEIIRRRF